jgi:hypothetical protein
MNIFEELRKDHEIQRDLIARLLETTGDSDERAKVFDQLADALHAHAAAEERYFYVPLMESDLTQDEARHSVAEHKELDDFVETLQDYDRSAPAWLQTARDLEHRLTHHLDEEEHEVFQLAGKALTESQKADLASEYRAMMQEKLDA